MRCDRCQLVKVITLDCTDSAGAIRLCSKCYCEIVRDNAELRERARAAREQRGMAA